MKLSKNIQKWLLLFMFPLLIFSCRSESEKLESGTSRVRINLIGTSFTNEEKLGLPKSNVGKQNNRRVQSKVIALNNEIDLIAELSAVEVAQADRAVANKQASARAALEEGGLDDKIRYKVAIFDAAGNYVTERNYVRNQEQSTEEVVLKVGEKYTFVAYSINSVSDLPEITFADANHKVLTGAQLEGLSGNADPMYFKKEMQITSSGENYLGVVLAHKFSGITVKIDASATGFNITSLAAGFDSHYPQAAMTLADGAMTRSGNPGEAAINFPQLDAMIVTGNPRIINGSTTNGSFIISNMTIDGESQSNLIPFNDLAIIPGVKYNLLLTLTYKDKLVTYRGQFASRIGGQIWMRHNLGADVNQNPDVNPSGAALYGNYYQFGRAAVVANVNTASGAIAGWNKTNAPFGSWNSGSESAPLKSSNDPCPNGYRLPTRAEYQKLLGNTTASNIGTWTSSSTSNTIGAAKVLTSKTDASVKLTFPATGYRNADQGILYWRGGNAAYWTSSPTANGLDRFSITGPSNGNSAVVLTDNSNQPANINRTSGFPIRCISGK